MKKYLFFIMLSCIYFSCSKDNKSTPPPTKTTTSGKTYTVNFNISAVGASTLNTNGIKQTNSIKQTDSIIPVSEFTNTLEYWVYNSSGALITKIFQSPGTSNYGQISDTFSAGTYNVVIIAQNNLSGQQTIPQLPAPATYSTGTFKTSGEDTFFKTFSLTVTDTTVTQNVTLNRIVGQLQVVVTDSIPANTVSVFSSLNDNTVSISTGLPTTTTYPIDLDIFPGIVIGETNYTMTGYVANTTSPFTVYITAENGSGVTFVNDTVPNITCQANTRTILSGNLFASAYPGVGFTVTFNNTWDDTTFIAFSKKRSPIILNNQGSSKIR